MTYLEYTVLRSFPPLITSNMLLGLSDMESCDKDIPNRTTYTNDSELVSNDWASHSPIEQFYQLRVTIMRFKASIRNIGTFTRNYTSPALSTAS